MNHQAESVHSGREQQASRKTSLHQQNGNSEAFVIRISEKVARGEPARVSQPTRTIPESSPVQPRGAFHPQGDYIDPMSTALKVPSFDDLYRQLRALPPGQGGEIINGELLTSPRPAFPHSNVEGEIFLDLRSRFRRKPGGPPTGWWILFEPELHLSTHNQLHVLSPDLAGWKRERMPTLPDAAFSSLAPDWICEILSPSNESYDRKAKARIYHDASVPWLWLVSPRNRTVEAYRREGAFWVQLGVWSDDDRARIEPFESFELDLAQWWDGLPPRGEP